MKKIFYPFMLAAALLATGNTSKAQLADGSIAPDFTLADINGTTHNLYTYLNQGYTVYIDISATWCGPCWSYHNSGALEDLYMNHGPSGMTGVSGTTTDDVMVIYVEGDGTTTLADLQGTGSNTQGDWVTGTDYPIINGTSTETNTFNNDYNIAYFPTIYMICPNRIISEVGQQTATNLYAAKGDCPPPATSSPDAGLLGASQTYPVCAGAEVDLTVRLTNNSSTTMTACTITASDGASTVATYNWTGSLAMYDYVDVVIGTYWPSTTTNITYTVTSSGDVYAGNNSLTHVYEAALAANNLLEVTIVTDNYPDETTWTIKNSAGTTVMSGGPYTGTGTTYTSTQTVSGVDCFTFEILDSYGDGICCSYGNGSYTVKSGTTTLFTGGTFADSDSKVFKYSAVSVEENESGNNVSVYPNPFNDNTNLVLNLEANAEVSFDVFNALGQKVMSQNKGSLGAGSHTINLDFSAMENGFYFVTVTVGENTITKKITLVK